MSEIEREDRATIFGEDAASYDLARPGYPTSVVDHVLGLTDISEVVEIGAGTGKATTALARPGLRITCLEPAASMAEILAAKGLSGVEVVITSFEDWPGPTEPADLVVAAQSWHWVDHSTAYERAREMLRPGGALALIWNVPEDRYVRYQEVYRKLGPEILAEDDRRIYMRDTTTWLEDMEKAGLGDPDLFVHEWSVEMTPLEYRRLCSTYSDHRMIPEPRRTALLDGLESAVERSGGLVTIKYMTRAFTGIR